MNIVLSRQEFLSNGEWNETQKSSKKDLTGPES